MATVSEKIDERILRLLGLEDVFDLDYDTYVTLLKEVMVKGRMAKTSIPTEEIQLVTDEYKRVKGKKGRFKPKKEKITASKVTTTKLLKGTKVSKKTLALPPAQVTEEKGEGKLTGIKKTLDSILKTLGSKFKFDQKQLDEDRKEKETEKRGKRESTLEGFKKGVAGIVAVTKKVLDPFQAIIDRIWRFVFFTLLGRAFTKFMEWMSDKGNQEKFNSFIEFLSDHWPALAGLYILFGTSFGKLVRGLLKGATRMIVALAMNVGKIRKFITKHKKLAFLGLALAPLATRELGNLLGENKETPESGLIPTNDPDLSDAKKSVDQAANTEVPTLNLGGIVPKLNLGGMVPSFAMGGFNPYGGMDFSGGVPIAGAGQDDTLIAAKTGEAILTERDQQDIGQRYVDRNTGQPLNIPQYLSGRKPGSVAMSNLRFPGFGGGFYGGGIIPKFNTGGMVGMQGGGLFSPVMRIMHGTKVGAPESIRSGGFREQPGMLGRGVYGSVKGWVADTYRGAGAFKGIIPGQGPRLNMVVPQSSRTLRGATVVSPRIANKGLSMADRLLQGQYPKSAKAAELRRMLSAPTPTMGRAFLGGLGSRLSRIPLISDMLSPQGTSAYDQLTGPNAYYNAPGYKGPKPSKKQGGGVIGSGILPGTGRVMAPKTIGNATVAGYQNRFLGIPLGRVNYPRDAAGYGTGYSQEEMRRYERYNPNKQFTNLGGILPALINRGGNNVVGDAFSNFGSNIRTIEDTAKRQEEIMRQMGHKPSGYVNLLGQPIQKRKGGGPIEENTGMDVKGATADRQAILAQPGEYMIPVDTVNRYGVSFFEKLVAMTDSNSNARLGRGTVTRPQITPYGSSGMENMITLPPVIQGGGGSSKARSAGYGGGSTVPTFPIVPENSDRNTNASWLGIINLG